MRQAKDNCDLLLMQDSHLDNELCKTICKEWKGTWAFNNRSNNSGGVAIYNRDNVDRLITNDMEDFDDSKGSLIGRTIKVENISIYVISAYAPCCDSSIQKRTDNINFLRKLEKLVMEKKSKGLEVIWNGIGFI